jgi:hypothetical protein
MELNQDNYENYLLLYIDNELTASERAAVEAFLESHPTYANELKALQAVQLNAEFIEYPDKSSLYRFEEMNASLDPAFKKSLYKNSTSGGKLIDFKKIYWAAGSIAAISLGVVIGVKTFIKEPALIQKEQVFITQTTPIVTSKEAPIQKADNNKVIEATIQPAQFNNTQLASAQTINNEPSNLATEAVVIENKETITENNPNTAINTANSSSLAAGLKVEKESFEEINTDDNDRVIYISNIELDGDKFRGITRRLGAIFKRNKTEKNK